MRAEKHPGTDTKQGAERGAIRRSAALMGAATATSRAFGFARVLVIAGVLGTTDLGNTFQGSNLVSNVLFELLAAGALSAVLVPGFVDLFARGGDADAERLAGSLLGVGLILMGAVAIAGVIAAPLIARLVTAGVEDPASAADQRELATFLLRFFIPQVALYAVGAVATAVLQAKRRFMVTAAAPIANTVIIVAGLVIFAVLRDGQAPGLDLSSAEKVTLGLAGTLGVAGFVGVPTVALMLRGFRLRPRFSFGDPLLRSTVRHAGWAGLQNASVGILLGAAVIASMAVPGGLVSYYVAYTFFLVPYAVLGQSVHDTMLPLLSTEFGVGDLAAFGRSLRWGLDALALLLIPATAAYVALARPIMAAVNFGETTPEGIVMMGGALTGLALGLFPYSAFLLLTRAAYAMGDSRTPTIVSVGSAIAGAVFMLVVAPTYGPEGRLFMIGLGVAVSYGVGALVLGAFIVRRSTVDILPGALLRAVPVAGALGVGLWTAWNAIEPAARFARLGVLAVLGLAGAAAYVGVIHPPSLRPGRNGVTEARPESGGTA